MFGPQLLLATLTLLALVVMYRVLAITLYRRVDLVSRSMLAIGHVVCLIIIASGALASFEAFSVQNFCVVFFGYLVVVTGVLWRLRGGHATSAELDWEEGESSRIHRGWKLPLGILLLAISVSLPPSQIVVGGQDPSLYVAAASLLARTGTTRSFSEAHQLFEPQELARLLRFKANSRGAITPFNGTYYHNDGTGELYVMFPRGPSYLLAFGMLFGISDWAFLANSSYFVLAASCFFLVARAVLSPPYALGATVLLVLCPAQLWFGRATYSEVCSQFLIFFALFHIVLAEAWLGNRRTAETEGQNTAQLTAANTNADATRAWVSLFIAGIGLSVAALMRLDQVAIVLLAITLVPFAALGRLVSLKVLSLQIGMVLGVIAVYFENQFTSPWYFLSYPHFLGLAQRSWLYALVALAVSSPLYVPMVLRGVRIIAGWLQSKLNSDAGAVVATIGVVGLLTWSFIVVPQILPDPVFGAGASHNANVRTMNDEIFPRLGVLCGFPFFLASFFGIILVLRKYPKSWWLVFLVLIFSAYCSELLLDQRNSPMLYWASRRYLPIIIPTIILLGTYGVSQLRIFSAPLAARGFVVALFVIGLGPMLWLDSSLLWWGEMNGARVIATELNKRFSPSDTVLIADSVWKGRSFTLQFLGGFEVIQLSELEKDPATAEQRVQSIVSRLKEHGKQVVVFSAVRESPVFGPLSPVESISAPFVRLGEDLAMFPNSTWLQEHQIHYQVR